MARWTSDGGPSPATYRELQRWFAAPLAAAATVVLVGLAAAERLRFAPPWFVVLLFSAAAVVAALAAALILPRAVRVGALATALSASGTACLLIWKLSSWRLSDGPADGTVIRVLLVIALPVMLLCSLGSALVGLALRSRLKRSFDRSD